VDLDGDGNLELAVGATQQKLVDPFSFLGFGKVWILFFDRHPVAFSIYRALSDDLKAAANGKLIS